MSHVSSLFPDESSPRQRLLVVQPLVGIGDMVWHKPWIDHLATRFDVILAAKPTARSKIIFHGTEGIVEWLDIDRSLRGRRGRHDGLSGFVRLANDFRKVRADAVLVMHHSASYALAAQLAGIPQRWGYGIGSGRRGLNRGAFLGKDARNERPYSKLGRFALANGFGLETPQWHMTTRDPAWDAVRSYCVEQGIVSDPVHPPDGRDMVIFGVGAMDDERQWPPSQFAKLAAMLHDASPEIKILLMGAPSEMPIIEAVMADPNAPPGLIANTAPLDQAVALLTAARAYVGNDTSLLNIAAACGRPAIGIFAQSEPLDYSDNIVPVALADGRFGEPGAIKRILADQAYEVVAATLKRQDMPR